VTTLQTFVSQHVHNHKDTLATLTHKYENVSKHVHKVHSLIQTITDNADHFVYPHYSAKISLIHVNLAVRQDTQIKEQDNVYKYVHRDIMDMQVYAININVP